MSYLVRALLVAGLAGLAYLAIAGITFSIRHPWATHMQQWMCFKELILFQVVDRNVIDPR